LKLKLDIPIIAMTAHAFAGEREKCLSFGMNEYIAKPINEKELYRLIRKLGGIETNPGIFKKNILDEDAARYQYINLQYMQEIGAGDKQYEKTVTELFIETVPLDLEMLELAFANKDLAKLKKTAHEMRTNVSVMGLLEKLQSYLDELEHEPFDESRFQQSILSIKTICLKALAEARYFYAVLLNNF